MAGEEHGVPGGGDHYLKELERSIRDYKLRGVLINSSHNGHYPDADEARPFFDLVTELDIPVMVIHSRGDGLAGFHHAQKNFAAAKEPKLFWETQGEHNELLLDRPRFIEGMERFIGMVEAHRKAIQANFKLQTPNSRETSNPKP